MLVVDDTVGSFCNVDVLPYSDVLLSSLTKSFSGYANVMGGSNVLNPLSPHYPALKALFKAHYHNEYFVGDADTLLGNSDDYLERSKTLNSNALAMANFLQKHVEDPASPATKVLYPSLLPDAEIYRSFMRRPTADFPSPGYGCLMSVDFESLPTAIAFYDKQAFVAGPHLGAHRTLALAFNALAYCKKPEERAYHRSHGLLEESVRLSAGLEAEEDLIDTLKAALDVAAEDKANPAGEAAA